MRKVNDAKSLNQCVPYAVETVPTNLCLRYYHTTFEISNITYQNFYAPFHFNPLNIIFIGKISEIGKEGSRIVYAISKIAGIKRICIWENILRIEINDYLKWSDIEQKIIDIIIKFTPKQRIYLNKSKF